MMNTELLKAKRTQTVQNKIKRSKHSYKFRLNAIAVAGQRAGKMWV